MGWRLPLRPLAKHTGSRYLHKEGRQVLVTPTALWGTSPANHWKCFTSLRPVGIARSYGATCVTGSTNGEPVTQERWRQLAPPRPGGSASWDNLLSESVPHAAHPTQGNPSWQAAAPATVWPSTTAMLPSPRTAWQRQQALPPNLPCATGGDSSRLSARFRYTRLPHTPKLSLLPCPCWWPPLDSV